MFDVEDKPEGEVTMPLLLDEHVTSARAKIVPTLAAQGLVDKCFLQYLLMAVVMCFMKALKFQVM